MSDIQKPSFSLLNQKEVDALVDFLNDKRNSINSDVMNQNSIDKLITLITGDSNHIILDLFLLPLISVLMKKMYVNSAVL